MDKGAIRFNSATKQATLGPTHGITNTAGTNAPGADPRTATGGSDSMANMTTPNLRHTGLVCHCLSISLCRQEVSMKFARCAMLGLAFLAAPALTSSGQYLWGRESGQSAFAPSRFPRVAVDGDYTFVVGVNTDAPQLIKRGNPVIEKLDRFGRPMWSTNGTGVRCNLKGNQLSSVEPNFLVFPTARAES